MKTASGSSLVAYSPAASDIISASWQGGERQSYKSVEAGYHDQAKAKRMVEKAGSGDPKRTLNRTFATKDQAKKAAEAELKQGNASKDTMEIEMVGNPFLQAEDAFEMPSLEVEYQGKWSVQTVVNKYDKSGYTTSLSLERPQ